MSIAKADITHRNRALAATLTLALCLIGLAAFGTTDAGARKGTIPKGNLVKNPSFKQSAKKGWTGFEASVKRVRDRQAPNGRTIARVKAVGGAQTYTIDDSGASAKNVKVDAAFEGSAWVRGIGRSVGQPVDLVVREWEGDEAVDSEAISATLTRRWQQLSVSYTAQGDGNDLDVYVARPDGSVKGRERFAVDAVTLTKGGDGIPPAPVNPTGGITTSQIATGADEEGPLFTEQNTEYRYIIIRDNLHDRVAELRSLHPEAQLILYKNVGFTLHEPGCPYAPFQGGGVSYCDADSHEDWFLHDSAGNRLSSEGYPSHRAMNIGKPAYQQAWLDAVLARLRDAGNDGSGVKYDGVFLDDVNTYPGHGMDGRISELSPTRSTETRRSTSSTRSPRRSAPPASRRSRTSA